MTVSSVNCYSDVIQDLRKKLGVPDSAVEFTLRVAVDEVVTITCKFYPQADISKPLIEKKYELHEIKDDNKKEFGATEDNA